MQVEINDLNESKPFNIFPILLKAKRSGVIFLALNETANRGYISGVYLGGDGSDNPSYCSSTPMEDYDIFTGSITLEN